MASWRRPPGRRRNVWLRLGSGGCQRHIPLSTLWRSEIASGHGATQRSTRTTRQRW